MKKRLTSGLLVTALLISTAAHAQARGQGRAPLTAKASAPIDITGYWTAVLTEDWHVRMLTAAKGDFGSGPPGAVSQIVTGKIGVGANPAKDGNIPYNLKGAQAAVAWDPAKDAAAGNQCKAYGAPGVMRQPTHLHISWADDNTLKVDADFGTQTRLLHFGALPPTTPPTTPQTTPAAAQPTLQGRSVASWI